MVFAHSVCTVYTRRQKHEPSRMNYYIFHDELTPVGVTVPAKSLGRYKKLNNFFPVRDRLLKSSFPEKGLYTAV